MSSPTKTNSPSKTNALQSYTILLYDRALHPELFQLKARRVVKHGQYELESWLMNGSHVVRFEFKSICATEFLSEQDKSVPSSGLVTACLCAGERDFEHRFTGAGVTYMNSVQTETLSDNLYASTLEEMVQFSRETGALTHQWGDETGKCVSIVDVQKYNTEVHAQAYHLIASGGIVVRSQTIFEHK